MHSPEPYYQDESVELYLGGAVDLTYLFHHADAMVTDPPYGIAYRSNQPRSSGLPRGIVGDDDTSLRDAVLLEWAPKPALVFGTWKRGRPRLTRQVLVWDTKGALGMGDLSLPWKPSHQEIYVLGSGFAGYRGSDVLSYAPVQSMARNGRLHPHQKPIALMVDLVEKCPGHRIIDPFAGSGTTLVAAKQLGRKAIGIEIDERYCEMAARRLSQEVFDLAP